MFQHEHQLRDEIGVLRRVVEVAAVHLDGDRQSGINQLGYHELAQELDAAAAFAGGSVGSMTGTLTRDVGPVYICVGR